MATQSTGLLVPWLPGATASTVKLSSKTLGAQSLCSCPLAQAAPLVVVQAVAVYCKLADKTVLQARKALQLFEAPMDAEAAA